jgi:hypothetical protein
MIIYWRISFGSTPQVRKNDVEVFLLCSVPPLSKGTHGTEGIGQVANNIGKVESAITTICRNGVSRVADY